MTRTRMLSTVAVAVTLAVTPAAFAQMGSPSMDADPSLSTPEDRSMSTPEDRSMSAPADRPLGQDLDTPEDLEDVVQERMGPEQRRMELVQTTLLNRFATLGFVEMRNFRKEGPRYFAEVKTQQGDWVNIEIDPVSGEVTTQR